ncbi:c-type cytochrome [Hymenobacter chitinivorans]|uniref:Cytochrome c553 n=1 Tax=Hymenobacter chitinivorans DSM 11115 TaxID=1121954 RepID=A0A2M9BS16_9BACT|nr:cytochrome c [Hymenobacter chitinivorans]PJJ60721.1 cytochrome c553 [Hymenobacter chitinivorans DSM 11115]
MKRVRQPILMVRVLAVLASGASVMSCFSNRQNEGATLYATHCSNCHGSQGEGLKRLIPPLAGADYLVKNRSGLACLVRKGLNGPLVVNGVEFNQVMPAADTHLTDSQITNILNFVQTSWGNKGEIFTIREVSEQLRGCGASDGR